jgi:Fe-S-cluster containining protein
MVEALREYTADSATQAETWINCDSCVGACCRRDIVLPLTKREHRRLVDAGTVLRLLTREELKANLAASPGIFLRYYQFETDCGNLDTETNQCNDYENRPEGCRDFNPGTPMCQTMKDHYESTMVVDLGMPAMPVIPKHERGSLYT